MIGGVLLPQTPLLLQLSARRRFAFPSSAANHPCSLPPSTVATAAKSASSASINAKTTKIGKSKEGGTSEEEGSVKSSRWEKSWREKVEELILESTKNKAEDSTGKVGLDIFSVLGPQWWPIRVSSTRHQEIAARLSRSISATFRDLPFRVYNPAVKVKQRLINSSVIVKAHPVVPGSIFIHCVMGEAIYDLIRRCKGVLGLPAVRFVYSPVNWPKPMDAQEMENIFKETQEKQEAADKEFQEQQLRYEKKSEGNPDSDIESDKQPNKKTGKSAASSFYKSLMVGSNVRVLSGPFVGFTGCLKKMRRKAGKATVEVMLFGKERCIELELNVIVADAS